MWCGWGMVALGTRVAVDFFFLRGGKRASFVSQLQPVNTGSSKKGLAPITMSFGALDGASILGAMLG